MQTGRVVKGHIKSEFRNAGISKKRKWRRAGG
jgi:hypothetical protein